MNPKTIFLSAFFLFASALCLRAQGTYEYGVISYSTTNSSSNYSISISLNETYNRLEGKIPEGKSITHFEPLNKVLSDLSKEGWEVYNSAVDAFSQYFYLKRKKP